MEANQTVTPLSGSNNGQSSQEQSKTNRGPLIIIGVIAFIVVVAIIIGIVVLAQSSIETTGRVRDIFIIFMALEFLILGAAMIILIIQLATLINLLQNEIKPILNSTNQTVNTLKGTAAFLSDNLVEPVMKMNEYLAGIKRLLDLLHLVRH
jgi:amino acid permease